MIKSEDLRKKWNEFWIERDHEIIESAPLIPINDDSLLWINSGVSTLKKYFDGRVVPENRRMAGIQKCIRTTDIENVGFTRRHATFFEMMGNFSIGDYFKEDAIKWSYEFLTEVVKLDKEKIYVTVYPSDEESISIWKELGLSDERIIKLEGNFWEIGAGPAGPDSEIFYDRGEVYDPGNLGLDLLREEIENDRYIEIWNNVFSMYNADPELDPKDYEELPSKNIDTGMGFERLLMIIQNADSIFETDLFADLISDLEKKSNTKYNKQATFRAIIDHTRTIAMSLSDGANFGNSGRDYVLRRLLRRAVLFGRKLGIQTSFIYELLPNVIDKLGSTYPNLVNKKDSIITKVKNEEDLFYQTLVIGEKKFFEMIDNSDNKELSGKDAFKLYDTYGFPFEITLEMAQEKGFKVSKEAFDECMSIQKENARKARNTDSSMNNQNEELINYKEESKFVGYDSVRTDSKVIALFDGNKFVDSLKEGYFVLDNTPFYAESGGQVSDSGYIYQGDVKIDILSIFKGPNKQHFHAFKTENELNVGDDVKAFVDEEKRNSIMKNHSSIHLVQKALRNMFGEEVEQAGSFVNEDYFRFDFTLDKKINDEEIFEIENKVNEMIKPSPTSTEVLTIEEANQKGAIALFEDKYDSKVRVVTIGESIELCGGTHVKDVADIEKVAFKNFESKGNNVYRIDGTTSDNIQNELFQAIKPYNDNMIKLLSKARKIVKKAYDEGINLNFKFEIDNEAPTSYKDVVFNMNEMERIKMEVQNLDKDYKQAKIEKAVDNIDEYEKLIKTNNDVSSLVIKTDSLDMDVLKEIIGTIANKYDKMVIFIANINGNNVNFVGRSNVKEVHIGNLVKEASVESLGNGGGSPVFAQGGGSDISHVDDILKRVQLVVNEIK